MGRGDRSHAGRGGGGGTGPFLIVSFVPIGTTCTNVWPIVRVAGLPSFVKKRVGPVIESFFQVPLTTLPLVAIQAVPLPVNWASRRCFLDPSLSGAKLISMITTFLGPIRCFVPASTCLLSPVTERSHRFDLRSYA